MDIAKPRGGFVVFEKPAVSLLIAAEAERWPRLPQLWAGLKERLSQTGHREGVRVRKGPPGARVFTVDADAGLGIPRIRLVYVVLGDRLTIHMVGVN